MKQTDVKVPPILLEGDQPTETPKSDRVEKFAVGPTLEAARPEAVESALSEGYGTGRLLLMARDPNCLYAHWDLTSEQQREFSEKSARGHLQVRVYRDDVSGPLVKEVPIEQASRHSFIEVAASGTKYVAELGYPPPDGTWQRIAVSEPAVTPADTIAQQEPVKFATLAFKAEPSFNAEPIAPASSFPVAGPVKQTSAQKTAPPMPALDRHFPLPPPLVPFEPREPGLAETAAVGTEQPPAIPQPLFSKAHMVSPATSAPIPAPAPAREWTSAQGRALAELIGWSFLRHEPLSSADIAQVIRGEFQRVVVSPPGESGPIRAAAKAAPIFSGALGELPPERRVFWFNVNAELVIYGATEPNAQVTLAGQPVELRADGTFSCRFALPDGFYQLTIAASSARGEVRQVELGFSRASAYSGEVGSHPQDPALKPPLA
jgi:uncharacterized protein